MMGASIALCMGRGFRGGGGREEEYKDRTGGGEHGGGGRARDRLSRGVSRRRGIILRPLALLATFL